MTRHRESSSADACNGDADDDGDNVDGSVGDNHFCRCIRFIIRCAKNGQTIMKTNHVGEISVKGHHFGCFNSIIFDWHIDRLLV